MNLLSLIPLPYRWLMLAALAASIWGHGYYRGAIGPRAELSEFKQAVAVAAAIQDAKTKEIEADNQKRKETADAEHSKAVADLNARIAGLRNARTHSSFVPTSTASSVSADRTCFSASELERAIRSLDQDVQGFVDEGSKAVADLNSVKEWAR